MFEDELGNRNERLVEYIEIQDASFTIGSEDRKIDNVYYSKDGKVNFVLSSVSGNIASVESCLDGYTCIIDNGRVQVRGEIAASGTIEFLADSFVLKLSGDENEYRSAYSSFEYVYDNEEVEVEEIEIEGNGNAKAGNKTTITIRMSEEVYEGEIPVVLVNLNGTVSYVSKSLESGKSVYVYSYTVVAGDNDKLEVTAIKGRLSDRAGNVSETFVVEGKQSGEFVADTNAPKIEEVEYKLTETKMNSSETNGVLFYEISLSEEGTLDESKAYLLRNGTQKITNGASNGFVVGSIEGNKISIEITPSIIGEGSYTLVIEGGLVTDAAGNASEGKEVSGGFEISDSKPTVNVSSNSFTVRFGTEEVSSKYIKAGTESSVTLGIIGYKSGMIIDESKVVIYKVGESEDTKVTTGYEVTFDTNTGNIDITEISLEEGIYYIAIEEGLLTEIGAT